MTPKDVRNKKTAGQRSDHPFQRQPAGQDRSLAAELAHAEQRERSRVADFLHDHIQPTLMAAHMRLEALGLRLHQEELRTMTEEIVGLLGQSIENLRSLTAELCPPVLRQHGLDAGLQWLARHNEEAFHLETICSADATTVPLEEATRLFLFHAARELLLNVVKHAHAQHAWIRLTRTPSHQVCLEVCDDGVGYDSTQRVSRSSGGLGLFSLHERLTLLGGSIQVTSSSGKGTRVTILVPFRDMTS